MAVGIGDAVTSYADRRFYPDGQLVEWSSITKTVTVRLLTELARAQLIDPATEVSALFPYLPLERVTLLDLCRHRAGLPMMHPGASRGLLGDPCRGAHDEGFLERISASVLDASRGRRGEFRYSNLGYAVLGLAMEKVTGRSWIDLVRDWVLPSDAFPTVTLTPEPLQQAVPRFLGARRRPWSMSEGIYRAAGGLWSSFDDLVAYAQDALQHESKSGWFELRDGAYFHTGQARDTGVCVVLDRRRLRIGVAHAMLRPPNAAKQIVEKRVFKEED